MTAAICRPEEVYQFWFEHCRREQWFRSTPDFDQELRMRFAPTHLALAAGVGDDWRKDAVSRLAAVIVLDQFARNIYRDTPLAFATDGLALREAKLALEIGADLDVPVLCRTFFYMPFEHAEDLGEQERSVALFEALGDDEFSDYARRHRDVILRFGRFPHRNAMLGRISTEAEERYLAEPGSGF